ncbi:MAG: Wzz/FepE/Etk N-terminal domain-containing protein [Candidatus Cloacimonetes bacterium]|nr:Wzz/FepE/Etk N-terminal domain-containing protein [Candidatus Cloacimonadota bacterium]
MDDKKINLIDIFIILAKGKKFIILFTLIMSLIAVIYSLVVTERWASEFTVYPLIDSGNISMASMASNFMENLGLGSQTTPRAMNFKYSAILKSRTNTENTIRKFNLIDYFEITEPDTLKAMDIAVKKFHSNIFDVLLNDEVHFMTIRITTKDKYFSLEMAQYYLDLLMSYTRDNPNNIGKQRRELLENRIHYITNEMVTRSEDLRQFQNTNNIIEIEEQAKAAIEGYGLILQDFFEIELELSLIEQHMTNSPRYRGLILRRQNVLETLNRLETGNEGTPYLLALRNISDNSIVIQEMIFYLDLYQLVLQTIYPQLEIARIEEINNIDRLEIIDLPNLPGKRAFPKRALICVVTFMVSFMFSSGCVLLNELSSDEDKKKLITLWKILLGKKQ